MKCHYYTYKKDGNTVKKVTTEMERLNEAVVVDREQHTLFSILDKQTGLVYPRAKYEEESEVGFYLDKFREYPIDANKFIDVTQRLMREGQYIRRADAETYAELNPEDAQTARNYNEECIRKAQKEEEERERQREEERRREQEEEARQNEEAMNAVKKKILQGGKFTNDEMRNFLKIATEVGVKISLRTMGWFLKDGELREIRVAEDGDATLYRTGTSSRTASGIVQDIVDGYRRLHKDD